jgi:hypothetical protein
MKLSLYAVLIGLSLVALPDSASAEGGFLSGLNPFNYTRQKKAPVSARAGDSSWKMPRLWPGGGSHSTPPKRATRIRPAVFRSS